MSTEENLLQPSFNHWLPEKLVEDGYYDFTIHYRDKPDQYVVVLEDEDLQCKYESLNGDRTTKLYWNRYCSHEYRTYIAKFYDRYF